MLTIRIDMRLTDDRVWNVIKEKLQGAPGSLKLQEIADEVPCHVQTVKIVVHRLQAAGRLKVEYRGPSKRSIYEILEA